MNDLSTGPGPFFKASELEFQKNQGWEDTEIWEGTEAECRAKQAQYVAGGATRVRIAPKGDGSWMVRAMFPFNSANASGNFVDTMELETNVTLRSAYQSPLYRKRFSDWDPITGDSAKARATLGPIADCVRKFLAGQPAQQVDGTFSYWNGIARVSVNTRELAVLGELDARLVALNVLAAGEFRPAKLLFENLAFRGVTGFLEYNQVFRRTVTAGSPQAVRANNEGAGQIWTTAEVIAWEGIPNDGWFDLPPGAQWHKDKPRALSAYGQKTQLTYSYTEIVTASSLFYEAYGVAGLLDL